MFEMIFLYPILGAIAALMGMAVAIYRKRWRSLVLLAVMFFVCLAIFWGLLNWLYRAEELAREHRRQEDVGSHP